jgi:hypothetical protein
MIKETGGRPFFFKELGFVPVVLNGSRSIFEAFGGLGNGLVSSNFFHRPSFTRRRNLYKLKSRLCCFFEQTLVLRIVTDEAAVEKK